MLRTEVSFTEANLRLESTEALAILKSSCQKVLALYHKQKEIRLCYWQAYFIENECYDYEQFCTQMFLHKQEVI